MPIGQLSIGDTLDGIQGLMVIVGREVAFRRVPVFNLTVEGAHTYRITSLGLLVHNGNPCKGGAKQMQKLSKGEIKALKGKGIDPHDLKPNSKFDLFKDKDGNIFVKRKNGAGPGDPTGINTRGGA